jgi:hypothetical protein
VIKSFLLLLIAEYLLDLAFASLAAVALRGKHLHRRECARERDRHAGRRGSRVCGKEGIRMSRLIVADVPRSWKLRLIQSDDVIGKLEIHRV